MRKSLLLKLLPFAALLFGTGCDDGYSKSVVYELRTDPIKKKPKGSYFEIPDRPGQLPLLKMSDVSHEHNPFHQLHQEENLVDNDEYFRDPMKASAKDRADIKAQLDKIFGSPAEPKVGDMSPENRKLLQLTEGPDGTLAKGSKLYRIHCLHCHGVAGDGRGPTARWVNPHPRDYRQGRFKFTSVNKLQKDVPAHRNDLLRIVEVGIEGTAMPSFSLLPLDQREAMVSYVIHLSLRGMTEFGVFKESFNYKASDKTLFYDDPDNGSIQKSVKVYFESSVNQWVKSQDPDNQIKIEGFPIDPDNVVEFKESVLRGKAIFTDPPAKYGIKESCISCHTDYGRRSTFREDIWGTFAKPNNLIQGVFRGGRRPVDIYRRIHSGILASNMLAFGKDLEPSAIWDLVNFVQVVGSPTMRRQMEIYVD